jgi:hypothetical protein
MQQLFESLPDLLTFVDEAIDGHQFIANCRL